MPKLSDFKITKTKVDALVADRDAIYFDADLKGFAVRTKPSGAKTYLVQYQNREGRTRRVSIGQHGEKTPTEARKMASALLGRVASGEDPAEDKSDERKAMTVKQLCESYLLATSKGLILGKRGLPKKASTGVTDKGRIERHILPLLGTRKVRDLSTPDINRFMRDVITGKTAADVKTGLRGRAIVEGGRGTATRTVGLLGGILSFAVSEGIIATNPVRGVKRPADDRREIRLSLAQYRAIGVAIDKAETMAWQAKAAVRLLALTGCRRGEVESLRWEDVDLANQCLRLSDSKTGRSVRPLGDSAVELLKELLKSRKGRNPFVLPGRADDKPYTSLPKVWTVLITAAASETAIAEAEELKTLKELTPHGLRHAFASVAGDLGCSEITIAALLGHSSASVTGRYVHQVDTALVAMASRVTTRIAEAMDGIALGAEIIPLRSRA